MLYCRTYILTNSITGQHVGININAPESIGYQWGFNFALSRHHAGDGNHLAVDMAVMLFQTIGLRTYVTVFYIRIK
ncbi:MAG: hypothetical protein IPO92_15190 [Saprospiraceae bacterium]|nr:hypothetical protein [Saprospiraceae bacterium]